MKTNDVMCPVVDTIIDITESKGKKLRNLYLYY
jgi:hypothetical protein